MSFRWPAKRQNDVSLQEVLSLQSWNSTQVLRRLLLPALNGLATDMELFVVMEGGKKPTYLCRVCGRMVRHGDDLRKHLSSHRRRFTALAEPGLKCSYCDKSCTNSANIELHLCTHAGDKPFMCDQCSKQFATRRNLDTVDSHLLGVRKDPVGAYQCNE